jgi:outer membrane protein assembly factor BamE (lipoprotein component of BamABCDE complex)
MRGISVLASAFLAVAIFGGGCASTSHGTKIDTQNVSKIEKGVTTRAEVEQMFGSPMNVSLMGDGRRSMTYHYMESDTKVKGTSFIPIAGAFMGGSKGKMRTQQLQVILTKDEVVEDYVMNDGTSNVDHSTGFGRHSMTSTPVATPASAK